MLPALALLLAAQAAAPPAGDADGRVVAIAAADTRMTVPVRLGDAGPYPFVVDTGAERTVVARQLAEMLALPPGPVVRLTSMTGTHAAPTVTIPALSVDGIGAIRDVRAPVLEGGDLGTNGLLGLDALAGRRVRIDFARRTMTVTDAARRRAPAAPDEIVVTARSRLGQLIVTDAAFDGRRIRVVIDTGAAVSVGNSAMRALVARRAVPQGRTRFHSVTGGAIDADYALVPRVRIGTVEIAGLPVAFADAEPFARLDLADRPALLLGMDALGAFRGIDIDFANREIRLRTARDPG